jgi:hypothetical protein
MASSVVYTVADHITLWVEQGNSIHIETREPGGDPVELAEHEARKLVEVLNKLIRELAAG